MAKFELKPRINFVTLGVKDVAVSKSFYERLGLKPSAMGNDHVGFYDANGVVLAVFGQSDLAKDAGLDDAATEKFRGVTLSWNANNEAEADAILAHAVRCGATLVKSAQKVFWGGYSGYFADPDGHLWEIAYNPFAPLDIHGHIKLP